MSNKSWTGNLSSLKVTYIHYDLINESLGKSELLNLSLVNLDEIVTAKYFYKNIF